MPQMTHRCRRTNTSGQILGAKVPWHQRAPSAAQPLGPECKAAAAASQQLLLARRRTRTDQVAVLLGLASCRNHLSWSTPYLRQKRRIDHTRRCVGLRILLARPRGTSLGRLPRAARAGTPGHLLIARPSRLHPAASHKSKLPGPKQACRRCKGGARLDAANPASLRHIRSDAQALLKCCGTECRNGIIRTRLESS